jgi:hypothetical protein
MARTGLGDQTGERAAGNGGEGEIDDIGIAEEVVEEGLDCVDGIGSSELK